MSLVSRRQPAGEEHEALAALMSSGENPVSIRGSHRVLPVDATLASVWAVEMTCLRGCVSAFEVADCLERIATIVPNIRNEDVLGYCRVQLDDTVKHLQKMDGKWNKKCTTLLAKLSSNHFEKCDFLQLPHPLLYEMLYWLPLADLGTLACVSADWNRIACSNILWERLYHNRFLVKNPMFKPRTDSSIKQQYRIRLKDPEIGDRVEVSWRGKFRLEGMEVYQGIAWWTAQIVEKNPELRKYKVHYPGWDSRWDEWVDLNRLRWELDRDADSDIQVNSVVELWCTGVNVPGAWLEARVRRVRNGMYYLGRILSSSREVWVPRHKLRPVTPSVDAARRMAPATPAAAPTAAVVIARTSAMLCSNASCAIM